jgi:hypothetical protein
MLSLGRFAVRESSGRHGEAGEELAQELRAQGTEAEFIWADVRHDDVWAAGFFVSAISQR